MNLNTARNIEWVVQEHQTAALIFGSWIPPGSNAAKTESWDGSTWTEVNDLNTAKEMLELVLELQTAGIYFLQETWSCPSPPITNLAESWDGSSWTETGDDLNTARDQFTGAGPGMVQQQML